MSDAVRLSGMVICQDEADRIAACLDALAFCDEIVVVDSGSTDGTLDLARAKGARVFERAWDGWPHQKDFGRRQARGRWVLNVDADEVVSPALAEQARALADAPDDDAAPCAYRIPFRNHFAGQWVRGCGYSPDHHVRLFRADRARWDPEIAVHERLLVDGPVGTLRGAIDHYSFRSVDDFVAKSRRYAEAFAVDAHRRGRRAGPLTIVGHSAWRFVRAYVLQAGFRDGTTGLVISGLQAYEVFQKYARLWELARVERGRSG